MQLTIWAPMPPLSPDSPSPWQVYSVYQPVYVNELVILYRMLRR